MNKYFGFVLVIAAVLLGTWLLFMRHSVESDWETVGETPASIRIVSTSSPTAGLLFVALDKGFFSDVGIEVTLSKKTTGKAALQAMLGGEADFATTTEIPVVRAWLAGTDVPVIATILSASENNLVVGRSDRGISLPSDLKGRRIGVTKGTNGEFLLDALLAVNGVAMSDVTVIHIKPTKMVDALVSGDVDAISTWNPYVIRAQKALTDRQVSFSAKDVYKLTMNLVAGREYVTQHPGVVERVLRALIKASEYVRDHPVEVRAIVSREAGMDPALLAELWDGYHFDVSLDQSLVTIMESQAAWMIRNGVTPARQAPNIFRAVYLHGLLGVAPEKITVIH